MKPPKMINDAAMHNTVVVERDSGGRVMENSGVDVGDGKGVVKKKAKGTFEMVKKWQDCLIMHNAVGNSLRNNRSFVNEILSGSFIPFCAAKLSKNREASLGEWHLTLSQALFLINARHLM